MEWREILMFIFEAVGKGQHKADWGVLAYLRSPYSVIVSSSAGHLKAYALM